MEHGSGVRTFSPLSASFRSPLQSHRSSVSEVLQLSPPHPYSLSPHHLPQHPDRLFSDLPALVTEIVTEIVTARHDTATVPVAATDRPEAEAETMTARPLPLYSPGVEVWAEVEIGL